MTKGGENSHEREEVRKRQQKREENQHSFQIFGKKRHGEKNKQKGLKGFFGKGGADTKDTMGVTGVRREGDCREDVMKIVTDSVDRREKGRWKERPRE